MKKVDLNTRPSAGVSRGQFTRSLLAAQSPIPLCGLCDLCAMLSPIQRGSRTEANGVHPSSFVHQSSIPPLWPL